MLLIANLSKFQYQVSVAVKCISTLPVLFCKVH